MSSSDEEPEKGKPSKGEDLPKGQLNITDLLIIEYRKEDTD